MAVKIRLARGGSKKRPHYSIVVADSRCPRDGKFIEKLGIYNPRRSIEEGKKFVIDREKAKSWLKKGAKPTDRVAGFLEAEGLLKRSLRFNPVKGKIPQPDAYQSSESNDAEEHLEAH
ncbi:30S ribosomal protein S16 [Ponticaulis sp.]|uniref:30S ribosomal protein S16 n=1 Tax=Ponticaulis sp. TaxID=2020902 RepID=UPI000B6E7ACC|nr:30S ribosomal protein S16 [Ponticaulis sp.]OUY01216.1 MAG: 30S ribosomal protein S16 [Hyphomonadaceae bacterium TMED5]